MQISSRLLWENSIAGFGPTHRGSKRTFTVTGRGKRSVKCGTSRIYSCFFVGKKVQKYVIHKAFDQGLTVKKKKKSVNVFKAYFLYTYI